MLNKVNNILVFMIIFSFHILTSKNKGLEWGDNSCYFDSSMQALSTLNDFNEDLKKYNAKNDPPVSVYLNLINLIQGKGDGYLKGDSEIGQGFTLRDFHLGFSSELSQLDEPTGQKDPSEFILKFLNDMEEQIPSLKKKFGNKMEQDLQGLGFVGHDLDESVRAQVNQLLDPLDRIVFSTLNQKICLNCRNVSEKLEPHKILNLDIESKKSVDIKELLKTNFRDSQISNYICGSCHKIGNCSDSRKIMNLPKYLIIHLSRNEVKYDDFGDPTYLKNSTPVTFDFDINLTQINNILSDATREDLSRNPLKYSLTAVIVHGGESVNSGHYWAYTKSMEIQDKDVWYLYDDENVSYAGKRGELNPDSLIVKVMKNGLDNNIDGYPDATPYVLLYELTEVGKDKSDLELNHLQQQLAQLKLSIQELKTQLQMLRNKLENLKSKL